MPPSEASAPGSIGKNRPLVAQMLVERLARDAGLDDAIEILGVHGQHLVHVAEVDRHAAERRVDVAFQRGAGAEGDDRHACARRRCARCCCTSSVVCGNTTASGGWFGTQVSVLPCCSRTACEVTSAVAEGRGEFGDRLRDGGRVARLVGGFRGCCAPAIDLSRVAANVAGMASRSSAGMRGAPSTRRCSGRPAAVVCSPAAFAGREAQATIISASEQIRPARQLAEHAPSPWFFAG